MALSISQVTRHQYYYRSMGKRPGRKPSEKTFRLNGQGKEAVPNAEVTEQIRNIKQDLDTDYGYHTMTYQLKQMGFIINHKKVHRLMKEAQLLKERHKKKDKQYVKYRKVTPKRPLEVLEMDIKYIWIQEARRYGFILTIIDTFTRKVLCWKVGFQMKSRHIRKAWEEVIIHHLQPADLLSQKLHVEVRNDNGPQMGTKAIRQFFKENHLNQVFTHPYTPQENGHIESFHHILGKSLGTSAFWSMDDLKQRLNTFYDNYNNRRLHGSLAYLSPNTFLQQWEKGNIQRQEMKHRKVKFKLLIPYHQLSGNRSLREASCLKSEAHDARQNLDHKEVTGPDLLQQPSVQKSPSVASC